MEKTGCGADFGHANICQIYVCYEVSVWYTCLSCVLGLQDNIYLVIYTLMSTWYFWFTIILVPLVALSGDLLFMAVQGWFFPYDYQIIQEEGKYHHGEDIDDNERQTEMMAIFHSPTAEERRMNAMSQLPGERSKHTGFSFDSPGFESFFALQEGVGTPAKSWDIARRASMKFPQRGKGSSSSPKTSLFQRNY
jgi:phospholipid-transporting ATPase